MNGDCYGSLNSHMDDTNAPSGRRDLGEHDVTDERSVTEQIRRLQQQREQQHMLQQAAQLMARGTAHGGAAAAAAAAAASATRDDAVLAEAAAYLSSSPAAAIGNFSSPRLPTLLGRMGQGGADLASLAAMSEIRALGGSSNYSALGMASGLTGFPPTHSPAEGTSGRVGIFAGGSTGLQSGLSPHELQLLHELQHQRSTFAGSSAASSLGDSLGLGASPRIGSLDATAANLYRGLGLARLGGSAESTLLSAHQGERLQHELTRQPLLSASALEEEAPRRSSREPHEVQQSERVRQLRRTHDELIAGGEVGDGATASVSAPGEREKLVPRPRGGRRQGDFSPTPPEGEARKRRKLEDHKEPEEAKLITAKSVQAKASSGSLHGTPKPEKEYDEDDDDDESDSSLAVAMISSRGRAPKRGGAWPMPRFRRRQDTDFTGRKVGEGGGQMEGRETTDWRMERRIRVSSGLVSYRELWDELSSIHGKNIESYLAKRAEGSKTGRIFAAGGSNIATSLPSDATRGGTTTTATRADNTAGAEAGILELQRAVENDFSGAIWWNRVPIKPDTSVTRKYSGKDDDDRQRLRGGGDTSLSSTFHSLSNFGGENSIGQEEGRSSATVEDVNFQSGTRDMVFLRGMDGAEDNSVLTEQLRRQLHPPKPT